MLKLGNGELEEDDEENIVLPKKCVVSDETPEPQLEDDYLESRLKHDNLIYEVFGDAIRDNDTEALNSRVILTTTNAKVCLS